MIIVHGVSEAIAALEAKNAQINAATRTATAKVLHLVERRTKEKLSEKSHAAGTPTPSGPGEPPALITGNLRRSITVNGPDTIGPGTFRGEVGPTAIYGRVQELGGGPSNLPARPYLQPAYDELRNEIPSIFREAWAAAIVS